MLASLPRTRDALRAGVIGWSTAELLARHITGENELEWLDKARRATVRELRVLLANSAAIDDENDENDEADPARTLTVTVVREDGWLFEGARKVAEAVLGPLPSERLLSTLLAEGYSTLLELVPECSELHELDALEGDVAAESEAQAAWCAERKLWRDEAEKLVESRYAETELERGETASERNQKERERGGVLSGSAEALDRELRRLCSELSERDLALGIVAESARKAEVWRRLGFATETQYARERLGVSLSSLKAKRILAARAARVPELAAALSSGRVGYEAAYLLSRVVTPKTAEEWLRRAERRTVKHLREEIEAAELLIRMGRERDQRPLDEPCLDALFELERCIVSGDWVGRPRDAWAGEGAPSKARGVSQMSGGRKAERLARLTLRFRVTEATYRFWRALERLFARVSSRICRGPVSFLRFLCENFCGIWLPALRHGCLTESGELPEYFRVYRRDAFRCTSPVCSRRDVTPHHLVFRAHGGGDEDENVASLCTWCHLHGVHEGRIAAEPPASRIRWRIGLNGVLRVEGRSVIPRFAAASE
jgi:hypothetical protein